MNERVNERESSQPLQSLIERQAGKILEGKKDPVSRLAQLTPTLAGYFSKLGTKDRMLTHAAILAMVTGTMILISR